MASSAPSTPLSTARPDTYRYDPLGDKEIRLLELLPGTPGDNLRLILRKIRLAPPPPRSQRELIQATLPPGWRVRECLDGRLIFERVREYDPEEAFETTWEHPVTGIDPNARHVDTHSSFEPAYEALSYVWAPAGNEDTAHVLDVDGSSDRGTLSVRRNLADGLRHLRWAEKSRLLWIDAICIDQADLEERSSQVAQMGSIYKTAHNVIVWFGITADGSELAFDVFRTLGKQVLLTEGGAWQTNSPGCEQPNLARPAVKLPYDDRTWQAIARILQRPWFERLWVWQEVRLAHDRSFVQCGPETLLLSHFRQAISCMSNKSSLPSAKIRGLILDAVEILLPFSNQPFLREVSALNWKGCADPRDKIYGILGAAPAWIKDRIKPRYDVDAAAVYRTFCLALIEHTRRLDFLDRCDIGARQIEGPTWVPDFSVAVDRNVRLPFADIFYAGGVSMCEPAPAPESGDTLSAAGVECGRVDQVSEQIPVDARGLLSAVKRWEPQDLLTGTYVSGETILDAFVTLLGLGYFLERWPQAESLLSLREATNRYREASSDLAQGNVDELVESLNFIRVRNRYFFPTDAGYMGLAFAKPEVGDRLCVLLGCPSPMLLRHAPSEVFFVVGPGYVHGLMDTEALLGPLPSPWRARMGSDWGSFHEMHFYNSSTQTTSNEDPRLPDDPPEWERLEAKRTSDDPWNFARYRSRRSGETINADPRMSQDALSQRGVHGVDLTLV